MLGYAFAIFVMLAVLSALIIVHECGHFSVARLFGFQTPVFGFGLPFGPYWVLGKKWGTEFRVHACLLGGFVAIPELGDESNSEAFGLELGPFRKFPIWQRALVAFAGVGFNIIFAYLIMFMMIVNLGMPVNSTVVSGLDKAVTVATKAGVHKDDVLKSVDSVEIKSSSDLIDYLKRHRNETVNLTVLRDGKPVTMQMAPNEEGRVGLALSQETEYKKQAGVSIFEMAGAAVTQLWSVTWAMLENLGQMFSGLFHFSKAAPGHPQYSIQDLHGVLAIIKIGADIVQQDWTKLFMFTILISMDLAIVNLVPWPALDGWHLFTMVFEAFRGKPMGEQTQGEFVKWGFISLLSLMAVIMFNDVTALIQGKLNFVKDKNAKTHDAAPKGGSAAGEKEAGSAESGAPESGAPERGAPESSNPESNNPESNDAGSDKVAAPSGEKTTEAAPSDKADSDSAGAQAK